MSLRAVNRAGTVETLRRLRAVGSLPRRVGPLPPRRPPDRIGGRYHRALVEAVCLPAREAVDGVLEQILALLAEEEAARAAAAPPVAARTDAGPEDDVRARVTSALGRRALAMLDAASREFARRFYPRALHEVVRRFGQATDEDARAQLDRQLRQALGVPLSSLERPTRDRIEGWIAENVDLIVTVPERYFSRLQDDVAEAFARGAHVRELRDRIAERYEVSSSDAERIARDQTLKLSATVTHDRLEALGVERAIWRTMRDNRVCDRCLGLDGRRFVLAEGIDGVMPGHCHPQDRCYAEPDLRDLLR